MGHSSMKVSLTYLRGLGDTRTKGRRYANSLTIDKNLIFQESRMKHSELI